MVGLDVGGLLFWMDSDVGLLVAVAESDVISNIVRPDAGPVVVLDVLVDALGDDRFSPGVSRCDIWNHLSCIVPPRAEDWDCLEFHWDSSVDCIPDVVNTWESPCGKTALVWCSDITSLRHFVSIGHDSGGSELYHPIVPHNRLQNMWRLSVFDSELPDFPDTGDPDVCLGTLWSPNNIGNVYSDFGTALLARGGGGYSRTPTPQDYLQEFAPMSPDLPFWEDLPRAIP